MKRSCPWIRIFSSTRNGLADEQDLRLRFDVLAKTKQPELCRYWTTRDRAANVRLFRLAAEVLQAIEAGVFHPNCHGPLAHPRMMKMFVSSGSAVSSAKRRSRSGTASPHPNLTRELPVPRIVAARARRANSL
jgi:hypothetical protein